MAIRGGIVSIVDDAFWQEWYGDWKKSHATPILGVILTVAAFQAEGRISFSKRQRSRQPS
jgi:hypothetical protein